MFYDDADFEYAYDPLYDFANDAYSGENLDVIVLQDTEYGPAKIWYIDENHKMQLLEELGEVDMGSYETLRDFIGYCKNNFTAERYIISFYNHGGGWMGACVDDTDNGWLTMDDMQKALVETGGVDIICFSAPCLMGAVESVYELRDCVDVYIGSEEVSGYAYWWGVMKSICYTLNNQPEISNYELGEKIIEFIKENPEWEDKSSLTMSATSTSGVKNLAKTIDKLSIDLLNNMYQSYELVQQAYKETQSFYWEFILDIYDFADEYSKIETNQTILQDLQDIKDALEEAVIAEYHGYYIPDAHGLSIHFPFSSAYYYYFDYYGKSSYGLDFAMDTHWDEFLHTFCCKLPYLDAIGSVKWRNVKPGETVEGSFTIRNTGAPESELNWEVIEWPEWGEWSFNPKDGSNLGSSETITVKVSVTVPEEENANFSGEIKIWNKDNHDNYDTVPVTLSTSKTHSNGLSALFARSLREKVTFRLFMEASGLKFRQLL
jgi:hypothetical protein